jgi:hypothetical protein
MLLPPDVVAGNIFGYSCVVNIDGTYAVISAPGQRSNGAIYVYTRSGTTWTLQTKITPSITARFFGTSLAINDAGTTIAAGGYGSVFLFRRTNTTWAQTDIFTPPQGNSAMYGFSISLDLTGNALVIGDCYANNTAGAVYVYTYVNSAWSPTATLTQADGVAGDLLGYSVSISGVANAIIAGAPQLSNPLTTRTGYCVVFTLKNSVWSFQQKLTPSDSSPLQEFGLCCQIANGSIRIVIGAPGYNGYIGRTYYYRTDDGLVSWNQQWIFDAPADTVPSDGFGHQSVLASGGSYIAISRPNKNGDEAVYIYSRSIAADNVTESFTLQKKLDDPSGETVSQFGWGLGISRDGNYFIIGAESEYSERGNAYIFA